MLFFDVGDLVVKLLGVDDRHYRCGLPWHHRDVSVCIGAAKRALTHRLLAGLDLLSALKVTKLSYLCHFCLLFCDILGLWSSCFAIVRWLE